MSNTNWQLVALLCNCIEQQLLNMSTSKISAAVLWAWTPECIAMTAATGRERRSPETGQLSQDNCTSLCEKACVH